MFVLFVCFSCLALSCAATTLTYLLSVNLYLLGPIQRVNFISWGFSQALLWTLLALAYVVLCSYLYFSVWLFLLLSPFSVSCVSVLLLFCLCSVYFAHDCASSLFFFFPCLFACLLLLIFMTNTHTRTHSNQMPAVLHFSSLQGGSFIHISLIPYFHLALSHCGTLGGLWLYAQVKLTRHLPPQLLRIQQRERERKEREMLEQQQQQQQLQEQ